MIQVKNFGVESGRKVNLKPISFHKPINMEHSIGNQAWNLSRAAKLGTFHWQPSFGNFQGPPSLEPIIGHQVGGSFLASFLLFFYKSMNFDHLILYFGI
jgi:hypothetical protein